MSQIQGDPGARPLPNNADRSLPPESLAAPSDMPEPYDAATPFWVPDWGESLWLMGWRWLIVVAIVLAIVAVLVVLVRYTHLATVSAGLIFKVSTLAVGGAISLAIWLRKHATGLRREPFCIHCGYSLVGLAEGSRCPECGRKFNLAVTAEYRRDPEWFAERYRLRGRAAPTGAALEAGKVASTHQDGTR